jgi:hypothetical protein
VKSSAANVRREKDGDRQQCEVIKGYASIAADAIAVAIARH